MVALHVADLPEHVVARVVVHAVGLVHVAPEVAGLEVVLALVRLVVKLVGVLPAGVPVVEIRAVVEVVLLAVVEAAESERVVQ